VYGVPAPGAPPLGALHLDLRFVNGKSWLVFGPYAGWSPKFLKYGHASDLPRSIKPDNVLSMLGVGMREMTLVNYLIGQLRLSHPDRVRVLREFVPGARDSDWELTAAGQRVQVIRRDKRKGGVLEFGTTVVGSADGSIAGMLGGSPGASTAPPIMIDVLQRCFASRYQTWLPALKEMVPSLGAKLSDEPELFDEVWSWGSKMLKLGVS
jgi:malate dehydrogenase (quinone)